MLPELYKGRVIFLIGNKCYCILNAFEFLICFLHFAFLVKYLDMLLALIVEKAFLFSLNSNFIIYHFHILAYFVNLEISHCRISTNNH